MKADFIFNNSAPLRTITAKVEVYNASTLVATYTQDDAIASIKIDRVGEESKFFGFGISQKATIELIDTNKELAITKNDTLIISFNGCYNFPKFYPTEINRDENSGKLTITAEDVLGEKATAQAIKNVNIANMGVGGFLSVLSNKLNLSGYTVLSNTELFGDSYLAGANLEKTETYREIFTAIAEVTQTIYYINSNNELVYKALDFKGWDDITINKGLYFELTSEAQVKLGGVISVTELGDNYGYVVEQNDAIQYVRDNPFWELREDIDIFVDEAGDRVIGATIIPFSCEWRGDFRTEPGDKMAFEDKSGGIFYSFLINDTLTYNGGLSQSTSWSYTDDGGEASNPTFLGEKLKQTYAKVDKANKNIELLVSETEATNAAMATIQLDTQSINAAVQKLEETMEINTDGIVEGMAQLTSRVDAAITATDLTIAIKTELDNGVEKVITSTGYTLDSEGLKISKSGTDINTQITENGMEVKNGDTAVLTANNVGVDAANLHATTYLIIGNNSRLEDYETNRTGCFWIGG